MNNNQRDSRWAHIGLGDGSTTIGASGCTVSVIGDVLNLTPDVVNQHLQAVQGFSGALIIWAKLEEAFSGLKINRVWTYNNDDVLNQLTQGKHVIVEVPATPIGGTGSHWIEYIGNHQCKDPWTGTVRPTSDFPNPTGYCVLDTTNYQAPQTHDYQKEAEDNRHEADTNWNCFTFLCGLLQIEVNSDDKNATKQRAGEAITNLQTKAAQASTLETQLTNKDKERDEAVNQAKLTLENQFAQDKETWSEERLSLNKSIGQLNRRLNEKKPTTLWGKLVFLFS